MTQPTTSSTLMTPGGATGVVFNLNLSTLDEIRAFCKIVSSTEMVPKAYRGKADDIMVAGMMGQKLGLDLFMSLQSLATINGIPSLYGDSALAIVRASGLLEDFEEYLEIDGQRVTEIPDLIEADKKGHRIVRWCRSKRKGMSAPRITSFSAVNAKTAKLWLKKGYEGKDTPWITSPDRMLMFRARGFNLRDEFGDVLKGTRLYEEAMDYDLDMQADAAGVYQATPVAEPVKATSMSELLKANAPKPVVPATPAEPTPAKEPEPAPSAPPPAEPVNQPDKQTDLITEIQQVTAQLTATAKGAALLNGIKKMFKMKPEATEPSDPAHYPLYVNALKEAVAKV